MTIPNTDATDNGGNLGSSRRPRCDPFDVGSGSGADIVSLPRHVRLADISITRSTRDFAWSYLDSSLTKGYPSFCQSANSITTAVTLVKPISLSCLAARVARPPLRH